jgi:bifunctional ADP-heptose synthase (sugar kinase/adenylyltransferase)
LLDETRRARRKIVVADRLFDLLHAGHFIEDRRELFA